MPVRRSDEGGSAGYDCSEPDLFRAALETVRSIPGWEVLTAHPEDGEIHARQKGRIFSPTVDHLVRIRGDPEPGDAERQRARLELSSRHGRSHQERHDARTAQLFQSVLEDRIAAGDSFRMLRRDR